MRPARLDGAWEGGRVSEVSWLDRDEPNVAWIVGRFRSLMKEANRSYRFDLSDVAPRLQFTRYDVGGTFNWHHDCDPEDYTTRKLTMLVMLSNTRDYSGGNLEVFPYGTLAFSQLLGAALVFPAFMFHRVTPVTQGVRNALVCWAEGRPFI